MVHSIIRHLTWFMAGTTLEFSKIFVNWAVLKLETPIDLTNPFSSNCSMAFQVSTIDTSLYKIFPLSSFGDKSPSSFQAMGQWIKYRSTYSSPKSSKVLRHAFSTKSGRWNVFQSYGIQEKYKIKPFSCMVKHSGNLITLLVKKMSSRLITPSSILARTPAPTSVSFW